MMKKVNSSLLSGVLALAAAAGSSCWGQTDTARLQGIVLDISGGSVGGAEISVVEIQTSRRVTVRSNSEDGSFSIPALPVGRYRIEVAKMGFKTSQKNLDLNISQVANIQFLLQPGTVTETVNVTSEPELVESASSNIGMVVQGRAVTELPLNGRNFTQLATLIPGVTRGVPNGAATGVGGNTETFRYGTSGGGSLSVNGLRPQSNNFMLDGVDNNESLVNTIVFFPPAEAIEQFKVQTSIAPAEFGRAGGGVVTTTMKSGTNEVHGSLFEFLRNSELDARPTFATRKNSFRRNQFGGTLGGPLVRNKLFLFGDYQGLRQSLPGTPTFSTVPSAAFRRGDFGSLLTPAVSGLGAPIAIRDLTNGQPFAANIIPAARLNATGLNYLNAFPLPNTEGNRVNGNYGVQTTQTQVFNDFDVKTDWTIGAGDTLFGRFSFGQDTSRTSSRFPALPAGGGQNFNRQRGVAIGHTHIFRPTLVNELRLAYTRVNFGYINLFNDVPLAANLGIPNANTAPELGGGAAINGGSFLDFTGDGGPYLGPQNTYQVASTMSYNRGAHSIRFGANIIRRQVNIYQLSSPKGNFDFSDPTAPGSVGFSQADMLAGFARSYTIGVLAGMIGTRSWETGFFIQDDWRVSRKLTLNAGLRYELNTWPVEVYDRQSRFDIVTGRILLAGRDGNSRSLVATDGNNFAPRLGFAYDLGGNSRTVIRGGLGMFYYIDRGGVANQLSGNAPFKGSTAYQYADGYRISLSGRAPDGATNSTLATGALPLGSNEGLNLNAPVGVNMFASLPKNVNSYVHQWSLQVQQQMGKSTVLSTGYVANAGRKQMAYYPYNQQHYNAPNGARNFPLLGNITVQETRGNSSYHGWQTQLERRFSDGIHFRLSYTWGHAIDNTVGAFDLYQPIDIRNLELERGSSAWDVRHRFVGSFMYEIPYGAGRRFGSGAPKMARLLLGGWQLGGIIIFQGGLPFNLSTPGAPGGRPDLVGPVEIYGDPDRYFSTASFARVPVSNNVLVRPGTLGRNVLVGPGSKTMDASVMKEFQVLERLQCQFRAEFFNITNSPVFANPIGDIVNTNFGRIRGTLQSTERNTQLVLRITF